MKNETGKPQDVESVDSNALLSTNNLSDLEELRQGFWSACLEAVKAQDQINYNAFESYHIQANAMCVALGGVSCTPPEWVSISQLRAEIERLKNGLEDVHSRVSGKRGNPKWVLPHLENLLAGRDYDNFG